MNHTLPLQANRETGVRDPSRSLSVGCIHLRIALETIFYTQKSAGVRQAPAPVQEEENREE